MTIRIDVPNGPLINELLAAQHSTYIASDCKMGRTTIQWRLSNSILLTTDTFCKTHKEVFFVGTVRTVIPRFEACNPHCLTVHDVKLRPLAAFRGVSLFEIVATTGLRKRPKA